MRNKSKTFLLRKDEHFEITDQPSDLSFAGDEPSLLESNRPVIDTEPKGTTVFQTSLNIAKLCMGSGTLALPFAAQKGGIVFNTIGLGVIVVWNYYCADCLLRCLDYVPQEAEHRRNNAYSNTKCSIETREQTNENYGSTGDTQSIVTEEIQSIDTEDTSLINVSSVPQPPEGTTTYGIVAWHTFGKPGLIVLDTLMIMLSVGLLTAYQAAIFSFVDGITLIESFRLFDKIVASLAVTALSCAKDISFLSKFSVFGLLSLALSFGVIFWEGIKEYGWIGFTDLRRFNSWPASLSAASSWFGVAIFGYGLVPFMFSFKDSMKHPEYIGLATKIGLSIIYIGYFFASNGIRVLFYSATFDGDVLQVLPGSLVSMFVRMLMTFVVCMTAPLIAVPCGEMIEGKLNLEKDGPNKRFLIRISLCMICTVLAAVVPGFVHVISFVGCFCVSIVGLVLPPLFCLRLTREQLIYSDAGLLLLGLVTTVITSSLTFHDLVRSTDDSKATNT